MASRHAGVLLHPSSLPGPGPVGELGPYADAFVDWLAQAGLDRWQVLPLHPVGPAWSPYASPSAFAGDPRLISVEALVGEGLLEPVALPWGTERVDHAVVEQWKLPLLRRAAARVAGTAVCREWVARERHWLDDWTLYAAIAGSVGDGWTAFPPEARTPTPALRREWAEAIAVEEGLQFLFARQWERLRARCHDRGIRIVGDLPLFVSGDGCDVWTHRRLFRFVDGVADPVAGVPPDYFSPSGQRWGNPTYDWPVHAEDGFRWWVARVRRELQLVDAVRIDHFRGLVANWAIAAAEQDARRGRWEPGPGIALFDALAEALGSLPLLAEDLGDITPDVIALRDELGLPGMKILQFAFGGGADNPYLPHNHEHLSVAYTGTHDNDTTMGWYTSLDAGTRARVDACLASTPGDMPGALIRAAYASAASLAVLPMQDLLGLGSEARMNRPGTPSGNWGWRFGWEQLDTGLADRCRRLAVLSGRA